MGAIIDDELRLFPAPEMWLKSRDLTAARHYQVCRGEFLGRFYDGGFELSHKYSK
jgi:hypothetical protein